MLPLISLCFILLAIKSSSSSSASSSSYDSDSAEDLFIGTFTATLGGFDVRISICEENDIFYLASRRIIGDIDLFNYINMVGRNTSVSDNEIIFGDTFRFLSDGLGYEQTSLTLAYNSGSYVLNGNIVTKSSENAEDCVAPEENWNSLDVPFIAESTVDLSDICGNCVETQRWDSATATNGVCWGFYDTDAEKFVAGGTLAQTVILKWDGTLRIADGTDLSADIGSGCESATIFGIRISEDEYLNTFQCVDASFAGGTYSFGDCKTNCDLNTDTCPLFDGGDPAHIGNHNILGSGNNENDSANNNEKMTINFSPSVMRTLWASLIVYTVLMSVVCWCRRQKTEKRTKAMHI